MCPENVPSRAHEGAKLTLALAASKFEDEPMRLENEIVVDRNREAQRLQLQLLTRADAIEERNGRSARVVLPAPAASSSEPRAESKVARRPAGLDAAIVDVNDEAAGFTRDSAAEGPSERVMALQR